MPEPPIVPFITGGFFHITSLIHWGKKNKNSNRYFKVWEHISFRGVLGGGGWYNEGRDNSIVENLLHRLCVSCACTTAYLYESFTSFALYYDESFCESQPWAIILAEIPNEFSNRVLCIGALDISNYSQTCATEAILWQQEPNVATDCLGNSLKVTAWPLINRK